MTCRDFREILDSYLSDELLTETNHEVLRHLEQCADCRIEMQNRRVLREKLKSAVNNAEAFQMREGFRLELLVNLRKSSEQTVRIKRFFLLDNNYLTALAACLILTFGLGLWFVRDKTVNPSATAETRANELTQQVSLANFAVGDHQNCAVKFNLAEDPIDINLTLPQYADLRQNVLQPLENSPSKYQFLESHICKFQGHLFTHIIFRHQGKKVSVLLTEMQNFDGLKNDEMIKTSAENYQIARFDWKNRAVFVVSDLSPQENSATAQLIENSARWQFTALEETKNNPLIAFVSLQ